MFLLLNAKRSDDYMPIIQLEAITTPPARNLNIELEAIAELE